MLKNAQNLPFEPDEDAPELSPEQIEEFKRIIAERRELSRKKTVSLRISQSTLNIAKAAANTLNKLASQNIKMQQNQNLFNSGVKQRSWFDNILIGRFDFAEHTPALIANHAANHAANHSS